jgi:DNA-binding SARP family transcriptional activator/streptogramin lyase
MLPARHVRILGSTELWWDGRAVALGGPRARALVAALALTPGEPVSRDRLAERLWGGEAIGAQAGRLDVQVSRLRRALRDQGADPALVETVPGGYRLALGTDAVDAFVAEAALARAREDVAAGRARAALEQAEGARELWRGTSLADLREDLEAHRLDELRREVEEEIFEARLALGEGPALVAQLEAAVGRDPLRIRLNEQLMRALHPAGREAEALAVFDRLRARLASELGLDPPAALRELHGRILRQEPAQDPAPACRPRAIARGTPRLRPALLIVVGALAAIGVAAIAVGGGDPERTIASQMRPDAIAVLDAGNGHLVGQAPVPGRTANEGTAFALVAYGSGWTAAEDGTVSQVDLATGRLQHSYPLGKSPAGMAAGPGDVWVASGDAPYLVRIQPATRTTVRVPLDQPRHGHRPDQFARGISFGAGAVWITRPDEVERLDPVTGQVVARIPLLGGISVTYATGGVWVATRDDGVISRIDPGVNRVVSRVTLAAPACCMASGPDALFVSSETAGVVTRITRAGRVAETFHVEGPAGDLAFAAGRLWVSGLGSGHITSIDADSNAMRTFDVGGTVAGIAASGDRVVAGVNLDARSVLARVHGPVARILMPRDLIADLDPATPGVHTPAPFNRQLQRATCAGLFSWPDVPAPRGERIVPELSRDGGAVSADGRAWTFRVRAGYRFSPPSNAPVTATTVAQTIERALSGELADDAPAPKLLGDVVGLRAYRGRRVAHVEGIAARGDELTIRLRRPVPDLPARLASSVFCVVPAGTPAVRDGVPDPLPSAGPYYTSAGAGGIFDVLERNPSYRGPRPHRFAALGFELGVDPAQAISRLRAGTAELVVSPQPRAGLTSTPLLVTIVLRVGGALRRDGALRRAISDALDRRALADLFDGMPASRLLPPGLANGAGAQARVRPPQRTGLAAMVTVSTCGGGCSDAAAEIARELERAGLRARTTARNPELELDAVEALDPDPADFLELALGRAAPPELARVLALSGTARDAAARALDLRLGRAPAATIPIAYPVTAEASSRRLGCVHVDPYAPGIDFAALCPAGASG